MTSFHDTEVRSRSVPTAAHLILMGFEPIGVIRRPDGVTLRFSPDARGALDAFLAAKQKIDALMTENE